MTSEAGRRPLPESGRQAAHVLLDVVSAWDHADTAGWAERANLALRRLNDVGAVNTTVDASGRVTVDVGNLVGGAAVALHRLVAEVATVTSRDQDDVVIGLREFLDQQAGPASGVRNLT